MPIELAQLMVNLSQATNGQFGSQVRPPRGSNGIRLLKLVGGIAIITGSALPWVGRVALIRAGLDSTIQTIAALAGHDVLWSQSMGNADLGTPTTESQFNSYPADIEFENTAKSRAKAGVDGRGFIFVVEQDTANLELRGL